MQRSESTERLTEELTKDENNNMRTENTFFWCYSVYYPDYRYYYIIIIIIIIIIMYILYLLEANDVLIKV